MLKTEKRIEDWTDEDRAAYRKECRMEELRTIELPWLEEQNSKGVERVDGVNVVKRLAEVKKILDENPRA